MLMPEQVKSEILDRISSIDFDRSRPIPSLRELSREYSIKIASVRKAVSMLQDEGILKTVHGRGTFLADNIIFSSRKKAKIIGLGIIEKYGFTKDLCNEWLEKEWVLAVYNSGDDAQDAKREEIFLKRAFQEGFAGVVLHPTPLGGTNMELCSRLRQNGMKIVYLSPPVGGQVYPCFSFLDHEHAGYQATVQMALKGYRQFIYCHQPAASIFIAQQNKGIRNASKDYGLKLLDELTMSCWQSEAETFDAFVDDILAKNASQANYLKRIAPATALIANQLDVAEVLRKMAVEAGRNIPDEIGIVSCLPPHDGVKWGEKISRMEFPVKDQVNCALEFAADPARMSGDVLQKWFKPVFVNKETSR